MVGTDSSTTVATKQVTVTGAMTPAVKYVTVQPTGTIFQAGQTIDLTSKNPWLADDTNQAEQPDRNFAVTADNVVQAVNNDQEISRHCLLLILRHRSGGHCGKNSKMCVSFWIGHGVRVFHVDNPHTKALSLLGMADRRSQG